MDFRPNPQASSNRPTPVTPVPVVAEKKENKPAGTRGFFGGGRWMQILSLVVIIGVAILLAGVALAIGRSNNTNESHYVDNSKYQAVFLTNNQVYFGKIISLNNQYIRISNVYFLNTNNSTTTTDKKGSSYTLIKLGCQQIPGATDQIVFNRSQVSYWENLLTNGQVAAGIQEFQKQNPKGPDCSQASSQTQASDTSTSAQGGSSPATTDTPSTTTGGTSTPTPTGGNTTK